MEECGYQYGFRDSDAWPGGEDCRAEGCGEDLDFLDDGWAEGEVREVREECSISLRDR